MSPQIQVRKNVVSLLAI